MSEKLYQILKDNHDIVKNLLRKAIENKDSSQFRETKNQLNIHMDGEKKYFYPPLRKVDKERIDESLRETSLFELQKLVFESLKSMKKLK